MNELTLFDQPIKTSLANKIDSFYSPKVQEKRLTQKERIFLACKKLGVANDRMMSELSGVPRYLVPDRRASLVKEERLKFAVNEIDPVTDKSTDYYEVTL